MPRDPRYTTLPASSKLVIRAFLAVFVGYSPRFSGPGRISMPRDPPVHDSSGIVKTRDFAHFWLFSLGYSPTFLGPGRISMPRDPRYTTLPASSKLVIRAFLAIFVGYSPRFLGPGRISMPRDPRYTTVAASSKLVISSISGCFHGL